MAGRKKPGIWAMEGKWSSSVRDVRSIDPMLAALTNNGSAHMSKHAVNTPEDLRRHLSRWTQAQHQRFNIGYIGLHGSPGHLYVGRRKVAVKDLTDGIPKPRLSGKVLHFGSCEVLQLTPKERRNLRADLGVKAITGFTEEVDFMESLAYEILLFDALTYYKRIDAAETFMKKHHSQFSRRLGFVLVR